MKTPMSDLVLFTVQEISTVTYQKFSQGSLSQSELRELFGVVLEWTVSSERVLETVGRLGITERAV
jgi:hypothetical protein